MWKYCLKKTAQVVIVMILISFFSFAIVYFAPGDISDMYVNPEMTEEQKANVIAQLGLDKSMTEQYFVYPYLISRLCGHSLCSVFRQRSYLWEVL